MVHLTEVDPPTVRSTERSPRAQNPDAQSQDTRGNAVRMHHVEPGRVPLRHATPSPPQLPDSLHRLAKEQSHRPPDFYLDTLLKTGSKSIEAIIRRRCIFFTGFVARMEDTRLPKCVMFGELVGDRGCVGGGEGKNWMGCVLDDLRAFGINADQWSTAAQDEGGYHKTTNQGAEHFMAKWIAAEKVMAGLRHAAVCPNVTGRTKERIAQGKCARAS